MRRCWFPAGTANAGQGCPRCCRLEAQGSVTRQPCPADRLCLRCAVAWENGSRTGRHCVWYRLVKARRWLGSHVTAGGWTLSVYQVSEAAPARWCPLAAW